LFLQLDEERKKLAAERKAFNELKYKFLLDNAVVPEWKEEEVQKLLMFDSIMEANLNLNILLASANTRNNKKKNKVILI
jgi:hypothetical protein